MTHPRLPLDPDLTAFEGWQFPGVKESFGMIGDAMPDSWGRKLLKQPYTKKIQTEAEVLLAVSDLTRMGGLRFKTNPDGEFLSPASTPKT